MIVLATNDGFTVIEDDNFQEFSVRAGSLSRTEFAAAIQASDDVERHSLPDHLWVDIAFLHRELRTAADSDVRMRLEAMLAYAASKNWVSATGTHVAAHINAPRP